MLDIGIYVGMPWEEYKAIDLPNQSMLKHGVRSMKHLKRYIDGEITFNPDVFRVGNAVHCMVAGELDDRYAVMPDFELMPGNMTNGKPELKQRPKKLKKVNGELSKLGKEWEELCEQNNIIDFEVWDGFLETGRIVGKRPSDSKRTNWYAEKVEQWKKENPGLEPISQDELEQARKCYRELWCNDDCRNEIDKADLEAVVIGDIEGVRCKARLDFLDRDLRRWGDLKTTRDIEEDAFYRQFKRLNYGFQLAFHDLLLASVNYQMQSCFMIAAEVSGDFDTGLIEIPCAVYESKHELVRNTVSHYQQCKNDERWPGLYPNGGFLKVPNWDMSNDEQLEAFAG